MAMADLRSLLGALGYDEPKTLLQSGNAVFSTTGPAAALEGDISAAIDRELGMKVRVLVRSAKDLEAIVEANPFVGGPGDPDQLHAVFLSDKPAAAKVKALDPTDYEPDEYAIGDRVIYAYLPNNVMGSKLPPWDKVLGVDITQRNWKTVTKLLAAATG